MAETVAGWDDLVRAEEKALAQGEEAVAASLAEQRLHLLEDALARGESLPLAVMARTQEGLAKHAQSLRRHLAHQLAQVQRQKRRAHGYRVGAGLVEGMPVAMDRRG